MINWGVSLQSKAILDHQTAVIRPLVIEKYAVMPKTMLDASTAGLLPRCRPMAD
jgi:hypothetical protein